MAITTRNDALIKLAQGNGIYHFFQNTTAGGITAPNAGSGFFAVNTYAEGIGSTYPGTLQSMALPAGLPTNLFTTGGAIASNYVAGGYLAYFYTLGTLNLAATGDQFTHDAATFPVTRTVLGVAAQPVTLLPMIYITTATTTTAAVMTLKTTLGAAGYVNQDGSSVIGVNTMTLPNIATVAQSGYLFMTEPGDSGVRDITQISVGTAAAVGAATIYGVELLMPLGGVAPSYISISDVLNGGLRMKDLKPAVATTGTASALLGIVSFLTSGTARAGYAQINATLNT